jgi:hypothetical protein
MPHENLGNDPAPGPAERAAFPDGLKKLRPTTDRETRVVRALRIRIYNLALERRNKAHFWEQREQLHRNAQERLLDEILDDGISLRRLRSAAQSLEKLLEWRGTNNVAGSASRSSPPGDTKTPDLGRHEPQQNGQFRPDLETRTNTNVFVRIRGGL